MASQQRAILPPRRAIQPSGSAARTEVSEASSQFDRALSWMRFPPTLEKQFLNEGAPRRIRYFLISGLLSLLVFNGFLLGDLLMVPDVFLLAVKVRLLWFTPFALAFLLLTWLVRNQVPRRIPPAALEYLVMTSGVLAGACLGYILSVSRAPNSQYYHVGLMVVIMYGNMVQRLRFWYAVAFSLMVYAIHIVGVLTVPFFNQRLILPMVALLGATVVFTLMASYALERDERRQYLLSLRRKNLLQDLSEVQARLQQLSRMDVLTGLFNRRHFQQYLQQTWQRARHGGDMVAIIMLDVDHFKRFNDRYGHPAGDQCLLRVAQALQDKLRRPGDLVARYGGEEFIAVLPHADADMALKAAQRVREAIAELGIPHEDSDTATTVTASVGVATCQARPDLREEDLIAAADSALYKAKQQGRNRVEVLSI
ncbi:MAG TPA: diguanylate cyclase [Aquabacterium sp.]|uniref:GGDEF domain-containing protein n=1 Tax=Aquabacterium sp. TaxID=1872578 RepID=UPI002E32DF1C|nr:diguanylate cyclase [Aquabacterium sp.]HEX5354681.1 diguanylate cyclase [Aquabacterium sp.]